MSESIELHEGDSAPRIEATTATESHFSLESLRGTWVLAYFYPRANTPG